MAGQEIESPTEGGAATPSSGSGQALDYIFHPRSVAVVGASRAQPVGPGTDFVLALKKMGCPLIYPVNPKYEVVDGLKCYPSLMEIEGPVDHVISSVPAHIVPQLVEDSIAKGVKTIHFFTAGFSETGEEERAELESRVVARAKEAGIRILGPNCMGLYVPGAGLSFTLGFPKEPGSVALLSQSGGNAGETITASAVRGIRYSKVISYGNAADIDESELLEYLAQDPETEIITAYIEGVKGGGRFLPAMRAAAAAKPVLVLKGGRNEIGARAAYSHTASLAGSIQIFDALCRQVGAVRANSVEELVDLIVAFRYLGPSANSRWLPAGPRVVVVGAGGGSSVFAADEIGEAGLQCPSLPERVQAQLRELVPVAGTIIRNPIDATDILEPTKLEQILRIAGQAENIDVIIYHLNIGWGRHMSSRNTTSVDPDQRAHLTMDAMLRAREATGKPIVVTLRSP
ncbi:MAG: CoA-binding protein, partial [Dehalococcoidia bacterium]